MAGGISSVIISIGAQTAQAVTEIGKVDKALGKTQTTGEKFASGLRKAAVPAALALTAISGAAIAATKAAAEDAQGQQKLADQLKRSTGASDAQIASTEDWITAMSRATATADDDLRPALGSLVRATGDAHEAQKLLTLALDTSAATGKDLSSVSSALGKAYNGSTGSLKKLVPSISDAALASGDFAQVQKELNKQVGGAAKGDAETAAGQYRNMTIQMNEMQEAIGAALLPVLQEFLPIIIAILEAAQKHSTVFVVIAAGVGALAAAVLAANAALSIYNTWVALAGVRTKIAAAAAKAYSLAQWLLNIALDANPIGLVVIALAALAAGLVLAWKYSGTFRNIVTDAFKDVVKYGWLLLGPLAPFALALKVAWQHSETFRNIVTGALEAVEGVIQRILDLIDSLKSKIGSIHIPHIPGINMVGGLAAPAGFAPMSTASGTAGGMSVNVTIQGAIDPETTAIAVRRVLERYDRRRGRRPTGGPLV